MDIYYTIYQITNNVNGKIYIGSHKTSNPNDNYFGSGPAIKSAIKKYGIENFTKQILYYLETEQEMYLKEAEIVSEQFISRKDTYNITLGGKGGWSHTKGLTNSIRKQLGLPLIKGKTKGSKHSIEARIKRSNKLKGNPTHSNFKRPLGYNHSLETKEKLSKAACNRESHYCETCDKHIKGNMNWDRHLKSKGHLSQSN